YYARYKVQGYLASAYYPIFDSQGKPVALAGADLSMDGIRKTLLHFLIVVIASVIFVIAGFMVAMYLVLNRQVVRPITNLQKSMRTYRKTMDHDAAVKKLGDFSLNNEIGDLAGDFTTMITEIEKKTTEIVKLSSEKERIGAELELARSIQASMLPNIFPAFPERSDIDVFASMTPAKEVGGDFYDFFLMDDDHLGLVMADVSGKGVPAALFMMISKILLNNYAMMSGTPSKALEQLNAQICKNNQEGMFVTIWLGMVEISTGKVIAANAGHEYPIIKKADGRFELFKDKHGFVVGGMDGVKYVDYEFTLEKGSVLLLYTDGVAEATNAQNELFGTDRMLEAINREEVTDMKGLLTNLEKAVNDFVGDAPQFDDLTMLGIRLL
ncbi:MAG: SpoIIE family protein phosphatase, partial [Lachnospiraceae bacterium]|nr:SpoIIE family protein phosphatase [Lachnospiraceae bacterium]